jgi:threonine dehydrogenase-like Zn-dependent dehydrogenase
MGGLGRALAAGREEPMRAVRCSERRVRVVEVPAPAGDGVRVRVTSAGICGSDLHMVEGGFTAGQTLGHEIAGLLPDGRPVAVEPLDPCGRCDPCRAGDYQLCELGPGMLLGVGLDGGMADEVIVPERALVPLPGGVSPRNGCLIEPLAVAAHGLRLAGPARDGRVAVVGGGTIGLCAVAVARAAGASVDLVARHEAQKEAGRRLGAGEIAGRYERVVDAAGSTSALEQAVELCAPGATLLLLATYWEGVLSLPAFGVTLKEVRIVPSSLYSRGPQGRDVDTAASVLAGDRRIAETLVTHRFPLDAAAEAFAVARDRSRGAIKVVLEP